MASWVIAFISSTGYWGVVLLMLVENVFPPIPSELIMPLAAGERGGTIRRGDPVRIE